LRKRHSALGFVEHFPQRHPGRQKVCAQVVATERREAKVTDLVRRMEGAAYQVAACAHMLHPRHHVACKEH
jgi:hypothetical protein